MLNLTTCCCPGCLCSKDESPPLEEEVLRNGGQFIENLKEENYVNLLQDISSINHEQHMNSASRIAQLFDELGPSL